MNIRIIQSLPSPKAEPFKRWLARVGYELGYERLEEIENPELETQRTRELYKTNGYPDEWIGKRLRSIAIREEITGEWSNLDYNLEHQVVQETESCHLIMEYLKSHVTPDTATNPHYPTSCSVWHSRI